jgi:hypothetical protein
MRRLGHRRSAWPEVRRSLALPLEAINVVVMTFTLSGALSGFLAAPVIARLPTGDGRAGRCFRAQYGVSGYTVLLLLLLCATELLNRWT